MHVVNGSATNDIKQWDSKSPTQTKYSLYVVILMGQKPVNTKNKIVVLTLTLQLYLERKPFYLRRIKVNEGTTKAQHLTMSCKLALIYITTNNFVNHLV